MAVIAADELRPSTKSHVAQILAVPADTGSVETALLASSIRPETEFRDQDRATAQWHFIEYLPSGQGSDLPARCPQGNCITAKIDEYAQRLREGNYDKWGAAGDLAFLIHFVGDIHQPLHTTTIADRSGTRQRVKVVPTLLIAAAPASGLKLYRRGRIFITRGTILLSRC